MSGLTITRGDAPLLISMPHAGTDLLDLEPRLVSPWLARKDADWWIEKLYDFTADLGATIVCTTISRTFIDVNRDPSGASLYPGQATTGLCPTTTFDGEQIYREGQEPDATEIAARKGAHFDPYHQALRDEVARLRLHHRDVVLYDCHSIRSVILRLFEGILPVFNLGTNDGASAAAALVETCLDCVRGGGQSFVLNGRFKGGWITRSLGEPAYGVHALQMELASRAYMHEPVGPVTPADWPTPYDPHNSTRARATLRALLHAALVWARRPRS